MRLLILNTLEPNVNVHLTRCVVEGFEAAIGPENVVEARYADAVAAFRKAECDAFLAFDGQGVRMPIIKELTRLSPLNILWTTEDPYELPVNTKHAEWFDYVFTNDRGAVPDYGGKAAHMPLAAQQHADAPLPLSHRYRDVFFAGAAWPNRVEILCDLIPRLAGLKTQFFLQYNSCLPKPTLPIPEHEWDARLSNADLLTAARYSKIVLYFERDFSTSSSRSRADSPANRLFEIAAQGVAQVAVVDPATIAPYFEPGKEILLAANAEEAARVIRELLADPDRLVAIGEAAQKRALSEHTYAHRARAIVKRVSQDSSRAVKPTVSRSKPLRVLHVIHGVMGQRPWGGVELCADQLQKSLGRQFDFHLLFARHDNRGVSMIHRRCGTGDERTLFTGYFDAHRQWIDPRRDTVFQKLLLEEDIHVVHFFHLLNHSLGYVRVAQALGRPTILDIHDYFYACPKFNLIDWTNRYCDLPAIETCDKCLAQTTGLPFGAQGERRQLMSSLFDAVDKVHFVSESERALVQRVLPIRNDKVFVQGVGLPPTSVSGAAPPAPPLRVAVIGNVAPNKGADTIIAVVQQLASEKKVHFTIAGDVQDGFRQPLEQLRRPNVVLHGPYKPEDIAEILQGHHVALFASPWPETFSVTLSEAFRAGVVPIAPAIGAFAERIRDGKNGLHVRGDVGSFMRALLSLLDDPVMFHKLRQGVLATKILTLAEESQGIASLYEELAEQYHLPGVAADASPDQDALSPISVVAVGPPPNPVAAWTTSTWRKALNLYRTQGAKALVRRAWQRATGRRSA